MSTFIVHSEFKKEDLIALHQILGDYAMFLARKYIPQKWDADEVEDVKRVEEHIEGLVKALV